MDTIWFALLLTGVLGAVVLIEKIRELRKAHKAKQKTTATEPIDGTDWQWYDNKANVKKHRKQTRRDLHESMKGKEERQK
jgi:cysteine synthase